jgi:hypothetical protein
VVLNLLALLKAQEAIVAQLNLALQLGDEGFLGRSPSESKVNGVASAPRAGLDQPGPERGGRSVIPNTISLAGVDKFRRQRSRSVSIASVCSDPALPH